VPELVHRPAPPRVDLRGARRILAVRLDNIGDVVMTGPALRAIRTAAPRARLTLLCSPAGRRAARLLGEIDETIEARVAWQDVGGLPFRPDRELDLIARLRAAAFDAAFVFTSFSQTAFAPGFACYLAGIPIRVGQAAEFGGSVLSRVVPPAADGTHQVDRNLRLVEGVGIPVPDRHLAVRIDIEAVARGRALLAGVGVDADAPFAVLAPGASAPSRRYPAERFAVVARGIRDRLRMPVVILGAAADREAASRIAGDGAGVPWGVRSLVGETSVEEWAALISAARLLVTSHSAPLHLADAVGTPVVCLFAGTDRESEWRPRQVPSVLLRRPTACAPCRLFDCPIGQPCLDIEPDEIVDAAASLLADPAPPVAARPGHLPPTTSLEDRWTVSVS
jgi:ADP-heptose:LPS heptosyltransferase